MCVCACVYVCVCLCVSVSLCSCVCVCVCVCQSAPATNIPFSYMTIDDTKLNMMMSSDILAALYHLTAAPTRKLPAESQRPAVHLNASGSECGSKGQQEVDQNRNVQSRCGAYSSVRMRNMDLLQTASQAACSISFPLALRDPGYPMERQVKAKSAFEQ